MFRLFKPPANDATFHGRPPYLGVAFRWIAVVGWVVDLSVPPAFPSRGSAAVGPPDLNLLRPLMIPTEGLAVVASRPRRGPLGLLSRPRPGPLGFNRLVADLSPIASLTSPWL